jgi:anti-sigma regulatory factor (Ser/Thr protein kinase)
MYQESRLTIPARLDQIEVACDFVATAANTLGMDDEAIYRCRLSVEEVCTNVIEHGYKNAAGSDVLEIVCRRKDSTLTIVVIDNAPLFNPLSLPDPDPSTPLWERLGGGWGVYFVKKYMDCVSYSHEGNRNHFIMIKKR